MLSTLVSHAYQQSLVNTCKPNPFIEGFIWEASNSDRVCPICAERDGKFYKKDELPLDHPNGMCTFTAAVSDDYAERLSDWLYGEDDPDIDNFARYLGYDDIGEAKRDVEKGPVLANAETSQAPTKEQKEAVEYYVSGEGMYVNNYLRERNTVEMGEIRADDKALIFELEKATDRKQDNNVLYRSVDASAIWDNITDGDFEKLREKLIYGDNIARADELIESVKGKVITDKGFMSTTKDIDVALDFGDFTGADNPVIIEFINAKRAKGFDLGKYMPELDEQMEQSEVLLHNNTSYKILDVTAHTSEYGKSVYIKAEMLDKSNESGIIRNRIGVPVDPTPKTLDMYLNPEQYSYSVAEKYHINLKGSGQKISLKIDDSLPNGTYGRTRKNEPTTIYLGKSAFISEEEMANTIAHELNHARSYLKGENAPEDTGYAAGDAITAYIRGER